MDKTPFFQNTFLKWEKILDKLPHRSYFKNDKDDKNLINLNGKNEAGPSEKNQVNDDEQNNDEQSAKSNTGQSEDEIDQDQAKVQADTSQFDRYQEVDDLINGAIENIQEAAAALANLAGSHENELKMVIMNILVKFHDWIDNIQKKLNLTKKALNDLRWILATKDIEIKVKNREVNELRQSITEYEQKLNTQEVMKPPDSNSIATVPVQVKSDSLDPESEYFLATPCPAIRRVTTISLSSSLKLSTDNVQPELLSAEHSVLFSVADAFPIGSKASEHEVEVNDIAIDLPGDKDLITQPRKLRKVPVALANMSASQTIVSNLSSGSIDRHTVLLDMSNMEVGTEKEENSRPLSRISEQKSSLTRIDSISSYRDKDNDDKQIKSPEPVRAFDQTLGVNLPDISALRTSILRASVNNGNQTSNQSIRDGTFGVYGQRLSSQTNFQVPMKEKPVIINITQPRASNNFEFRGRNDERDKREVELKEKLSEIRRENEKLKKDKLKYESALKNVLFHGFMSLLKEDKLQVPKKRITKICYTPCAPCQTITSSSSSEPSVPSLELTESLTSQEPKRGQSKKYNPPVSKQSSRNTFCLFKQKDVPCLKIPELYTQAERIGNGVKTICQGGKCSRAAYYNRNLRNIDRVKCCKSSSYKSQSHTHKNSACGFNISPAGLEEYTRVMGCKNVLSSLQRQ